MSGRTISNIFIKCFEVGGDYTLFKHYLSNMRASNCRVFSFVKYIFLCNIITKISEFIYNSPCTFNSFFSEKIKIMFQFLIFSIKEITENVNFSITDFRAYFNPRNYLYSQLFPDFYSFFDAINIIMISYT